MGYINCLDVLTKIEILAPTVFEPRNFQPGNWGILEDKEQPQPTT
jgi:hypothetical protein